MSRVTTELMRGMSEFAVSVNKFDQEIVRFYNPACFVVVTAALMIWLWPIVAYLFHANEAPASMRVRRRVIRAPLVVALAGFFPWLFAVVLFPVVTLMSFGRWNVDLVSQQVFSPLVSGFLAATSTYLMLDWHFRRSIVPNVFPGGRVRAAAGGMALGVQSRLFIFLMAVAFVPMFTIIGLIRAASAKLRLGLTPTEVMSVLDESSAITFGLYMTLGFGLTVLFARTLTGPLGRMAEALERVEAGDLDVSVAVDSADEVGALEDGVNSMVRALREKDHIMRAFGRVVEPAVRDRLLDGRLRLGGDIRTVTVLFIDLRGFTAIAERVAPDQVVATLNGFFTVMTRWVRECGGVVDKFIGDAMMVVFGLFDNENTAGVAGGARVAGEHSYAGDDGATAGLRCALGVHERLAELNEDRNRGGQPSLGVSMGLHSGQVLAGTIGAEDRHEYTVVGDTVNVAARLQQACKEQGRDLLVSEATCGRTRDTRASALLEMDDVVRLRGRSEPVRVFGLSRD